MHEEALYGDDSEGLGEQGELFICDITDVVLKDLIPTMEYPFYSVSKAPDREERTYPCKNGTTMTIVPSVKGRPTIYDKDVLIYAISQLVAAMNKGEQVGNVIRFQISHFLRFANRGNSGAHYRAVCDSVDRLAGMLIVTNAWEGHSSFHLVDKAFVKRRKTSKAGKEARAEYVEFVLSDWVISAVEKKNVLSLSPKYFELSRPLERRLYELCRKHCGVQPRWRIGLDVLHRKTGSLSRRSEFLSFIRNS